MATGEENELILRSSDNRIMTVSLPAARLCETFRLLIESRREDVVHLIVPVEEVVGTVLLKIIEWLEYHKYNLNKTEWDSDFFAVEKHLMCKLTLAAHYLDITAMLQMIDFNYGLHVDDAPNDASVSELPLAKYLETKKDSCLFKILADGKTFWQSYQPFQEYKAARVNAVINQLEVAKSIIDLEADKISNDLNNIVTSLPVVIPLPDCDYDKGEEEMWAAVGEEGNYSEDNHFFDMYENSMEIENEGGQIEEEDDNESTSSSNDDDAVSHNMLHIIMITLILPPYDIQDPIQLYNVSVFVNNVHIGWIYTSNVFEMQIFGNESFELQFYLNLAQINVGMAYPLAVSEMYNYNMTISVEEELVGWINSPNEFDIQFLGYDSFDQQFSLDFAQINVLVSFPLFISQIHNGGKEDEDGEEYGFGDYDFQTDDEIGDQEMYEYNTDDEEDEDN